MKILTMDPPKSDGLAQTTPIFIRVNQARVKKTQLYFELDF